MTDSLRVPRVVYPRGWFTVRSPHSLCEGSRVYVAGHRGLVGSAVRRCLEARGHTELIARTSQELDLRDRNAVHDFFSEQRPTHVILAAAKVGGIVANSKYPAQFISDNLRIQVNVLDAACRTGTRRLLFLGSSCIYPRMAPQPIPEDALLTGPLEATNDAYAIAKIAGILHVQALRRQYGVSYISAMPTNLYGPGDNFDPETSHVLPALIRKFHEAVAEQSDEVVVWGTGAPRRQFLHVDDLARACVLLLERYDSPEPINIVSGEDITIRELAEMVARVVGFKGRVTFDTSKPDGTPRKSLDITRIRSFGWRPRIALEDGIRNTYHWFKMMQKPLILS